MKQFVTREYIRILINLLLEKLGYFSISHYLLQ